MLRLRENDLSKMSWNKFLNNKKKANKKKIERTLAKAKKSSFYRHQDSFRSRHNNFIDNHGFWNKRNLGRNITVGVLISLGFLWFNPVLKEARNKDACMRISMKLVNHFYPNGEEPLNSNEFALYSAYKDCTFGD